MYVCKRFRDAMVSYIVGSVEKLPESMWTRGGPGRTVLDHSKAFANVLEFEELHENRFCSKKAVILLMLKKILLHACMEEPCQLME